jgi:hypothetical protein
MKVKDIAEKIGKNVEVEDSDTIVMIDKEGSLAVHWPYSGDLTQDEISKIMFCLSQVVILAMRRALKLGLDHDDMTAITLAAHESFDDDLAPLKVEDSEKGKNAFDETKFLKQGYYISSGSDTIH